MVEIAQAAALWRAPSDACSTPARASVLAIPHHNLAIDRSERSCVCCHCCRSSSTLPPSSTPFWQTASNAMTTTSTSPCLLVHLTVSGLSGDGPCRPSLSDNVMVTYGVTETWRFFGRRGGP
jgi:hypothetical protein